jgi:xanthine dehydrogenase small subunit
MTHQTIRFIRRGQTVTWVNVPPTRTLLDVLREDLVATGTKEGCGEGDCGACTVVLGEMTPAPDGASPAHLTYRAVNSCIRLAHSIDGLALWTVEDLATDPLIEPAPGASQADGAAGLHPVQQALVQCHASQCGFCTPGFAMSLFGLYQSRIAPTLATSCESPAPECAPAPITREQAQTALSGNLCRCTGYRPILDAAQAMEQFPAWRVNEAELLLKLKHLKTIPRWNQANFSQNSAYMAPHSLADLLALRSAHPQAQLVAGCTDVGLWITKQHRDFAQVLDLTRVAALRQVQREADHLVIGAAVTLNDAFAALVADRPQLRAFTERFAGLPVRNAGTLGGNVANGSPIGDGMPLLIALGASVVLASTRGTRTLPLEQLYTGYRQNVMAPDELLGWIRVPLAGRHPHPNPLPQAGAGENSPPAAAPDFTPSPPPEANGIKEAAPGFTPSPLWGEGGGEGSAHEFLRVYKISKRFEDDISAVCLAVCLQLDGQRIVRASIGVGGVAATPVRAIKTEATLHQKTLGSGLFEQAGEVLRAEFAPISDMRASAAYRREVLGHLLLRFWLEMQGTPNASLSTLTLEALA